MLISDFRAKLAIRLAGLLIILVTGTVFGQDATPWSQDVSPLPAPTGMVNDYAGVIDEATKQQLETRLRAFKEKTNPPVELAVAVRPHLQVRCEVQDAALAGLKMTKQTLER